MAELMTDNDTQYGNLLKLDAVLPKGMPDHHRVSISSPQSASADPQYIVIDFEYAAPNPRGYDLANHFHEWRANYHHPTLSHSLQPHFPYPSMAERENFYRAYLSIALEGKEETIQKRKDVDADKVERLEREVRVWSPACSVFWALWGIIQAEEHVGKMVDDKDWAPDFDYLVSLLSRGRDLRGRQLMR
jgi:choline kinase